MIQSGADHPSGSIDTPFDGGQANATEGVGLSNPQLSAGRRKMLDLVNRLHTTGVQVDIDLPRIAVIGSQSAGKSSLIESISGITLPRAAGTCTRCPTECRLSRSSTPWQCIVSLRFTTDAKGQALGQARNETFGPTIFDKSQVEDRIRRAQLAILNPAKPMKFFLEGDEYDDGQDSQLSFSNNCISLQISGPDVADLSFCDLPGLIASVSSNSKGGGNDIALVESLVNSYIKKPNCIILLTVTCETDFENQGAHRLAKERDPDGKRTIGVLTKPDRIPTGEESSWLSFIRNEKEPLENNWFCVKQPSSNDLKSKMTWAQARQRENDFFSSTAPWSELDAGYQKYLRTGNLVTRLSLVLSDLISKRLPDFYEELEHTISITREALESLPLAPSDNPQREISSLLHSFMNDLRKQVNGVPDEYGLIQAITPAQVRFKRAIRSTAPNFRPFEREYEDERHMGPAKFLVNEEGEMWDNEASEDEAIDDEDENSSQADCDDGKSQPSAGSKRKNPPTNKIYIDEVMTKAYQARTRELPGHFPHVVQTTFIKEFIKLWKAPALELCKIVHSHISDHLKKLVAKHFIHFGQGHLEQRVKTVVHQHIETCFLNAKSKISWLLELEEQPFSLNTHYLSDYKEKFLTHYKGERKRYNGSSVLAGLTSPRNGHTPSPNQRNGQAAPMNSPEVSVKKVLAGLAELGFTGLHAEHLLKLLPADEMEPALIIMADVRAYFQVAYKRISDTVPLAIDHELVRGIERDLLKVLYDQLGVNGKDGHEISRDLAQESPQVADRRSDLQKKLQRLEIAHKELLRVGAS